MVNDTEIATQGQQSSPHLLSPVGSVVPQKRGLEVGKTKAKVTRACDICKAKKSKCSGEQPCDTCRRRGLDCQYEAVYSRGKAPTPRRSGPANLDGPRLSPVQYSSPGVPCSLHPTPRTMEQSESILSRLNDLAAIAPRLREPDTAPEVPSRASPGLEVAGQYSDPTSGLSFLHRAWRRISNDANVQIPNGHPGSAADDQLLSCAGDKPFNNSSEVCLPTLDRGRELLKHYFDVCIATFRMLHRPSVESWLSTVIENSEAERPLESDLGRAKAATVMSVLAIAAFHEGKAMGTNGFSAINEDTSGSQSDEFFCEAQRLTDSETGLPRLESAQSRLIQVLYLLMSCRFNQAWYTFGHALQIISALGLHRRDDRKKATINKRDFVEEQCRKRTFWVAYILDKYLGVIFGRPTHYHDEDIDQDLPVPVNDEDMTSLGAQIRETNDCYIEALIVHAKLAQIAEKISREVYSIKAVPDHVRLTASHRLGAELRSWKAALPPFLGAIHPSSLILSFRRQAIMLKLAYCHAVMLAHRPFLLKNTNCSDDSMRTMAAESVNECIAAAQSVLEMVDRMAREGRLFHAFWWTHYVCFCALVVVYVWAIQESNNLPTLNERRSILDKAEHCLHHLAQATASNSPSRRYSIILQELRAEAKRKTARPVQESCVTRAPPHECLGESHGASDPDTLHDTLAHEPSAAMQMWQPLFGSPLSATNTSTPGLQSFYDNWQTVDWLQLDSSAFGPFSEADAESLSWINPT
ncbi:hypothetical protein IAQ61_003408 [Plenodomus lingam]|uniref:uncharacterized protein n=1 Tax=Leptosphaeria maculans TaxID=5022 RepID=UPI00331EE8B4|nr:hypothetical protein IAQ61_003408 [Plenodomus lingam]